MDYGGLGGLVECRPINTHDTFEMTIARLFGDRMKLDTNISGWTCPDDVNSICADLWSALANVVWKHINGDTASYSFRAAGDLIAAIRGQGNYMDWYFSEPYATVSDEIARALASEGWTYEVCE